MRQDLEAIVGKEALVERSVHDLWPLRLMRERAGEPWDSVLVARPTDYEQVCRLLAWAQQAGVGVVPLGGGSGVCGAAEARQGELAIDLGALDRILEVDPVNLRCRVQAGVIGLQLEERLGEQALTLGHYPSSLPVSQIGGLVSTRSSGQESTRYGSVEHMLLGLTVALPDGTLAQAHPGPRSAVGPALHQLMVGAEGSLGIVLEAVLRVHRLPSTVIGAGYLLEDVESGLAAMREVVQRDLRPLVLRLYDPQDTVFQGGGQAQGCLLVAAVAGEAEVATAEHAVVDRLLGEAGGRSLGPEPWRHWLGHRFDLSAERLQEFLKPANSFLDTIEVASAWETMPALYGEIGRGLASSASMVLCHFSHPSGQGCCAYFTFAGAASSEEQAQGAYRSAWQEAMEACFRHGATISHHHGVGQARAAWAARELGGWWPLWQALRDAADPARVMSPRGVGGRHPGGAS